MIPEFLEYPQLSVLVVLEATMSFDSCASQVEEGRLEVLTRLGASSDSKLRFLPNQEARLLCRTLGPL